MGHQPPGSPFAPAGPTVPVEDSPSGPESATAVVGPPSTTDRMVPSHPGSSPHGAPSRRTSGHGEPSRRGDGTPSPSPAVAGPISGAQSVAPTRVEPAFANAATYLPPLEGPSSRSLVDAPSPAPPVSGAARPFLPSAYDDKKVSTGGAWTGAAVEDEEDELVGQLLSNTYLIDSILGEGGMGRVYIAHHTRIRGKRFAIKALHPEFLRKPDVVKRFRREAEAAASIASDHVVGVYDVDEAPDGRPFIVAELLEGVELGDLLDQSGKLPVPYTVRIVQQICEALGAAHALGIVHRDIKPENVFLTGPGERPTAKVLDFGISLLEGDGTKLTQAGSVMGTPSYMPPEQARGQAVDARADIYAVGAILYRAVTGHVPFERSDPMATLAAVLTEDPVRPRAHDPSLPEALETVIQRAMAKDRDHRPASMAELADLLEPFTATREPRSPRARAQTIPDDPNVRAQLVTWSLAASITAVIGLGAALASALHLVAGRGPSTLELVVVGLCMVAAFTPPVVLMLRRWQQTVWNDTARVGALVEAIREPLVASTALYGAGWLLLGSWAWMTSDPKTSWGGWPLVLLLLAAGGAAWKLGARKPSGAFLRKPLLALLVAMAAPPFTLVAGMLLQGGIEEADGSAADASEGGDGDVSTPAVAADDRAPSADVVRAEAGGVEALEKLAAKYPKDPEVLKALMKTQAGEKGGLTRALDVVVDLFTLDPSYVRGPEVREVIDKALKDPKTQQSTLHLLATKLGSWGVDRVWDVAHGPTSGRIQARKLLDEDPVYQRATKAVQIAWDLEKAKTCEDKVALLDRLKEHGDERAVEVLQPFLRGSRRGCGLLGLGACPAACRKYATEMNAAIDVVKSR